MALHCTALYCRLDRRAAGIKKGSQIGQSSQSKSVETLYPDSKGSGRIQCKGLVTVQVLSGLYTKFFSSGTRNGSVIVLRSPFFSLVWQRNWDGTWGGGQQDVSQASAESAKAWATEAELKLGAKFTWKLVMY
jgi:hypothetical protein